MKIEDVVKEGRRPGGTRARVLEYLNERPDEVFRMRDSKKVAEVLDVPPRTAEHCFWSLAHDGLIAKARFDGRVWYGSHAAIEALTSLHPDAVLL